MQTSEVGGLRRNLSVTTPRPRDARPASAHRQRPWPLTPRETEVLAEMASGKTNAAIATVLFISRKAVEKHVNSIFSKLLLPGRDEHHPRVQAVLVYLTHTQSGGATTWGSLPWAQPLAATARSSATESRITVARSRRSSPLAHRCMATRNTVMPASAARLAWGSVTPR